MSDADAFLAAILADPADDTPRLVYADWLEEQPPERPCPKCGHWSDDTRDRNGVAGIRCCGGMVVDTADRDLAAFIRVQYELVSLDLACRSDDATAKHVRRRHDLMCREVSLKEAHPEWSRCPCPATNHSGSYECPQCRNSLDLFRQTIYHADGQWADQPRTVTFARGFVDEVGCTLAEAIAPDGTPTPWAVAVVKAVPVRAFVASDREPSTVVDGVVWRHQRNRGNLLAVVPQELFAGRWEYTSPPGGYGRIKFATPAAARDALHRALATLAREAAGLKQLANA